MPDNDRNVCDWGDCDLEDGAFKPIKLKDEEHGVNAWDTLAYVAHTVTKISSH